jgi:predicted dehydrogenase
VELAGVVTRSPERRQELTRRFPGVPACDSLAALVAAERAGSGLDAVTVTTPPQTRRELVLEALDHGLHVVADKPFAPGAAGARELEDAAVAAGRLLAVYHNRRWDSDVVTLRSLVASGCLGTVSRFHSTMDQDSPGTLEGGPADPSAWGFEPRAAWGRLHTADGTSEVPAEQGSYVAFYEAFAAAIRSGSPLPVTAAEGVEALRVLDAARASDASGRSADLDGEPR